MASCSICGQWAGIYKVHPDCEKAVAEGRVPERVREAEDKGSQESVLGDKATWNADAHALMAGILIPVAAIGLGLLLGNASRSEDPITPFAIGFVVGGFGALMYYFKARGHALDVRRRQMHMNRN